MKKVTLLGFFFLLLINCSKEHGGKEQAQGFNGLSPVLLNEKWGFVDKKGEVLIAPQFESVGIFREELAYVSVGGKWGFIDKSGKFVINPQFDNTRPFSEGLAIAKV